MALLDPIDCRQAEEHIAAGHLVEAVRLLAQSPHRQHRAVRRLLLELGPRLVAQASHLFAQGSLEAAWQAIEHAAQCATLEGEGLALRQAIAAAYAEAQQARQWQAGRLEEARRLAAADHLRTALGKLAPIAHPDAQRLRADIEDRLAQFERYLAEARNLLDHGQVPLVRLLLEKARRILPHDPELLHLAEQWRAAITPAISPPHPATEHAQCWAFGPWAWVVLSSDVLLGRVGHPSVHLPLAGGLRARHARLLRDAGHYRLLPCLDERGAPCQVTVNGQPVRQTTVLHDRDRIALGQPACTVIFRLPVAGCSTAMLEAAPGEPAPVYTDLGDRFGRVVLLDQQMLIRPTPPAHLVLPDLPCRALVVCSRERQLELHAEGGTLAFDDLDPHPEACRPARPGRWLLRGELDEAEILGRAAAGLEPKAQLTFRLAAYM